MLRSLNHSRTLRSPPSEAPHALSSTARAKAARDLRHFHGRVIDEQLAVAGWVLQDIADFDRSAAEGVAVREFPLTNGPCDYLLFVVGKAAGVIGAKKADVTLSGVAEESAHYAASFRGGSRTWPMR